MALAQDEGAAVVLLSGGLDSAVAALLFAAQPDRRIAAAVFCDYGQRAAQREQAAAAALAARWRWPLRRMELPWLGELAAAAGSALLPGVAALPTGTPERPGDARSAAAVWVPARNAVLVSIAAAVAETLGAAWVVTGWNAEEAATFPDNSAAFAAACDGFLAHGTRNGVRVQSPTLALDKAAIVAEARRLGLGPDDFWSCYDGGQQPCGRCESCLRSRWSR
jgi:7-cyano-7-deazaguanine synthase